MILDRRCALMEWNYCEPLTHAHHDPRIFALPTPSSSSSEVASCTPRPREGRVDFTIQWASSFRSKAVACISKFQIRQANSYLYLSSCLSLSHHHDACPYLNSTRSKHSLNMGAPLATSTMKDSIVIAIDRGGTFTDVWASVEGKPDYVFKLLSVDPDHYRDAP